MSLLCPPSTLECVKPVGKPWSKNPMKTLMNLQIDLIVIHNALKDIPENGKDFIKQNQLAYQKYELKGI